MATTAAADTERARFARDITRAFERSRESIFEVGRLLIEAKASLAHGEWLAMIESDLPFRARYAQMFMRIASDHRLVNTKHASLLPTSPSTLYEISKLSDETLALRLEDGTINPTMERRDIATVVKAERRAAREIEFSKRILALPDKKYGVMYEDYEWDDETYSEAGKDRHASNYYLTSTNAHTPEEIVERTKDRFACAADDCAVFSWATPQHHWIAMRVMELRGLEFRSEVVWKKIRPGKMKGKGHWFLNMHEILMVWVRGSVPAPAPGTQWDSAIEAPVTEHSRKPEIFLEMIEQYFPNVPKIELNRRGPPRPGWDSWGLEAEQPRAPTPTAEDQPDLGEAIAAATAPPSDEMPDLPECLRRA
jgi:hypothetical protein